MEHNEEDADDDDSSEVVSGSGHNARSQRGRSKGGGERREATAIKFLLVQPKSLQECRILYDDAFTLSRVNVTAAGDVAGGSGSNADVIGKIKSELLERSSLLPEDISAERSPTTVSDSKVC